MGLLYCQGGALCDSMEGTLYSQSVKVYSDMLAV